jgi:hypothetical protein
MADTSDRVGVMPPAQAVNEALVRLQASLESGNKSKAPGAVVRPGAAREFQFPEYGI